MFFYKVTYYLAQLWKQIVGIRIKQYTALLNTFL